VKPPRRSVSVCLALASAVCLVPSTVEAQDDVSAVVEYRQSIMQSFRIHMGGVRAALANTVPMDHAGNHAAAFQAMAQSLANAFPEGSASPDSRALPAIWESRDDFMNKVSAIQGATADLVEATESGDSEAVGVALQAVRGACRECHSTYRGPAN
jgi:cytochrome c556